MKSNQRNLKQTIHRSMNSKHFFDNSILNQLNIEEIKKNSHYNLNTSIDKNLKHLLTPNKKAKNEVKTNNYDKIIQEYINNDNEIYFKDNKKVKSIKNINSSNNLLKKNNLKVLYKKYLLGNDVILPLKTINDVEKSNIPYFLYNNSKNITLFNPLKNKIGISQKVLKNQKSYKTIYTLGSSNKEKKNERIEKYKKKLFLELKDSSHRLINSNNNKQNNEFNLYASVNLLNNSKKEKYFKTRKFSDINRTYFNKNISPNKKPKKENISLFPINKNIYLKTNYNRKENDFCINSNENTFKDELKNNKETEDNNKDINIKKFNKLKNLIDEPCSLICLMYNKMKNSKINEMANFKKSNLKQKICECKKDINKLEQRARYQIFNLRKQVVIGNENKIKGKIISTNTFFDLAYGGL